MERCVEKKTLLSSFVRSIPSLHMTTSNVF